MPEHVVLPAGAQVQRAPVSDDFNRYIQDMTQQITEIELWLSGSRIVVDENGNKSMKAFSEPIVNDVGRDAITSWLKTYLNPNVYMSAISTADVTNNYLVELENLGKDLLLNHRQYNLQRAQMGPIYSKISSFIFFALRKAETDKKFIYENMQSKNTQGQAQQQQSSGILGGLI